MNQIATSGVDLRKTVIVVCPAGPEGARAVLHAAYRNGAVQWDTDDTPVHVWHGGLRVGTSLGRRLAGYGGTGA